MTTAGRPIGTDGTFALKACVPYAETQVIQKKNSRLPRLTMPDNSALVIEDDELVRLSLVQQLRQLGVSRIDEAADADSGRRALEGPHRYELIIADLRLPGGDAVELLRSAAGCQAGAGLILISALGDGLLRSVAVLCRGRGLRVLGALRKPVRAESLRELVSQASNTVETLTPRRPLPSLSDLRSAMERRGIGALVQPKISAVDGKLQGVEVLAQWNDPRLGSVPAARLAQLADDGGLGAALVQYMTGLALRICADWRSLGEEIPVAINLGIRELQDLHMPEWVERMLRSLQINPEYLTLEVAEHLLLDNTDALDILSRMRLRGVRIALDNFGKGQASALRLQRLPVSELKIDPSFVRGLPDSVVASATAQYAVRLAQGLGIQTTAVGVESAEQAEMLKTLQCDFLQGYWVSRPMPPDALPDWARARRAGNGPGALDSDQRRTSAAHLDSVPCPQTVPA